MKTITGFQNMGTDVKLLSAACKLFSTTAIPHFPHRPLVVQKIKTFRVSLSMCLRYMRSIPSPFRSGLLVRSSPRNPTLHFAFIASIHLSTAQLR